jgi:hypothetical protein
MRLSLFLALLGPLFACAPPDDDPPPNNATAIATYTFGGEVFAVGVDVDVDADHSAARNVSAALPHTTPAADRWLVPSVGGAFFALSSETDGNGEVLVVVVDKDVSVVDAVAAGGAPVFLEGMPAVRDDGAAVFFAASGGPHALDLSRSDRDDSGAWSAPLLLTSSSSGASAATKTPSSSKAPSGTRTRKWTFGCSAEPKRCTKVMAPVAGSRSRNRVIQLKGGRIVFDGPPSRA